MADSIDQEGGTVWVHQAAESTDMTVEQRIAAVYEELRMDVYRYVLTLGAPPQTAQDITQDSFLRFCEVLCQGVAVDDARAWLLRVAHNLTINTLSAKGFTGTELAQADGSTTQTAEDQLIEDERHMRLRVEIGQLSAQQRGCVELRAQGLRYREIGEIMSISTSTVGEFLRRAVARLREALDE